MIRTPRKKLHFGRVQPALELLFTSAAPEVQVAQSATGPSSGQNRGICGQMTVNEKFRIGVNNARFAAMFAPTAESSMSEPLRRKVPHLSLGRLSP
jgi:hypothetical protein